jgi:glucose/arabinose dehydrogenase
MTCTTDGDPLFPPIFTPTNPFVLPADEVVTTSFGQFNKRVLLVGGEGLAPAFDQPAYVRFGPDGKLYVTTYTGHLYAISLDNQHNPVAVQVSKPFGNRLLTGLAFDKWASPANPVLYVANCDPPLLGAPNFSGRVSRLEGLTSGLTTDLVTGLPRSFDNHMTFGAEFGPDRRLYFNQGGNTNNGAPSIGIFGNRSETTFSAAVLSADVRNANTPGSADLSVYAPGHRNPYGLCLHSNGLLYAVDQGADQGLGAAPDPDGVGTVSISLNQQDKLNVLLPDRYYGHPNPARNELEYRANLPNGTPYQQPVATFPLFSVATGITEYDSPANGGSLFGKLLTVGFVDNNIHYVTLSPNGQNAFGQGVLTGGFGNPLDLTVGPDGAIYIIEAGESLGFGGEGPARISVLEPLSPAFGQWKSQPQLTFGRSGHATVAAADRLFVVGGVTSTGQRTNALSVHQPGAFFWTDLTSKPGTPIDDSAAAAVNNKIYVFGGMTDTVPSVSGDVWEYDPVFNDWSPKAPMPQPRAGAAAVAHEGKIYVFGGFNHNQPTPTVAVYDPSTNQWEDLVNLPMPTPRDGLTATIASNDLIFCIAGRKTNSNIPSTAVEAFDPVERRWIEGYAALPVARRRHAAAQIHGKLVVAGGQIGVDLADATDSVLELDWGTNSWRTLTSMPRNRYNSGGAAIKNVLYQPGGTTADSQQDLSVTSFTLVP